MDLEHLQAVRPCLPLRSISGWPSEQPPSGPPPPANPPRSCSTTGTDRRSGASADTYHARRDVGGLTSLWCDDQITSRDAEQAARRLTDFTRICIQLEDWLAAVGINVHRQRHSSFRPCLKRRGRAGGPTRLRPAAPAAARGPAAPFLVPSGSCVGSFRRRICALCANTPASSWSVTGA